MPPVRRCDAVYYAPVAGAAAVSGCYFGAAAKISIRPGPQEVQDISPPRARPPAPPNSIIQSDASPRSLTTPKRIKRTDNETASCSASHTRPLLTQPPQSPPSPSPLPCFSSCPFLPSFPPLPSMELTRNAPPPPPPHPPRAPPPHTSSPARAVCPSPSPSPSPGPHRSVGCRTGWALD